MSAHSSPLPSESPPAGPEFQAGGLLSLNVLYAKRSADVQIIEQLRQGRLCYVLAPRQIGKSSLLLRARDNLEQQGWKCLELDLQLFATDSENEFFSGILDRLARDMGLSWDSMQFRQRHLSSSPGYLWASFLLDILLPARRQNLAIFIDELDVLKWKPFGAGDFLFGLRNALDRATQMDLNRGRGKDRLLLSICLAGVAQPIELARDSLRSPFEIGREIVLGDFTRAEIDQFSAGIEFLATTSFGPRAADLWLDAIFHWTDGHPYLTQKLCEDLRDNPPIFPADIRQSPDAKRQFINKVISDRVYRNFIYTKESYLHGVKLELEKQRETNSYRELISLYRRIYINQPDQQIEFNSNDIIQKNLILHGLIKSQPRVTLSEASPVSILIIRNRVFAELMGRSWLSQQEHPALVRFNDQMIDFFKSNRTTKLALTYKQSQELIEIQNKFDLALGKEFTTYIAESQRVRRNRLRILGVIASLIIFIVLGLVSLGNFFYQKNEHDRQINERAKIDHDKVEFDLKKNKQQLEVESEKKISTILELTSEITSLESRIFNLNIINSNLIKERNQLKLNVESQKIEIEAQKRQIESLNEIFFSKQYNKYLRYKIAKITKNSSDKIAKLIASNKLIEEQLNKATQIIDKKRNTPDDIIQQLKNNDDRAAEALAELDAKKKAPPTFIDLLDVARQVKVALADGKTDRPLALRQELARRLRLGVEELGAHRVWLPYQEVSGLLSDSVVLCPQASVKQGLFVTVDARGLLLWTQGDTSAPLLNTTILTGEQTALPAAALGSCSRGIVTNVTGKLSMWDGKGTKIGKLSTGTAKFLAMLPSSEGEQPEGIPLLVGSGGKVVARYYVKEEALVPAVPALGHEEGVSSAAVAPDGTVVVSATEKTLYLWDFRSGERLWKSDAQPDPITIVAFSLGEGGTAVLSGSRSGKIKQWTRNNYVLSQRRTLDVHQGAVLDAVLTEGGRYIVSAGIDGYVYVTDPRDGKRLFTVGKFQNLHHVGVTMDGTRLIVSFADKVRVYRAGEEDFLRGACGLLRAQIVRSELSPEQVQAACDTVMDPPN